MREFYFYLDKCNKMCYIKIWKKEKLQSVLAVKAGGMRLEMFVVSIYFQDVGLAVGVDYVSRPVILVINRLSA